MQHLIDAALADAYTYSAYRTHLTTLLAAGRTTGPNQGPTYIAAATINQSRMDRLDRRVRLLPELETAFAALDRDLIVLTITEGWCGDAAQIVPLVNHLAELSPHLTHRLVLRDEHTELMDHFLTDGGRGIPMILFLDAATHAVVGRYGPRPAPAQQLAMDYKYQRGEYTDYDAYNKALHTWYARDKTRTTQRELAELLPRLAVSSGHE